jgi:hypothetical protein
MPTEEDAGYSDGEEMIHSLPGVSNDVTVATLKVVTIKSGLSDTHTVR